jgi:hypothetical protein
MVAAEHGVHLTRSGLAPNPSVYSRPPQVKQTVGQTLKELDYERRRKNESIHS